MGRTRTPSPETLGRSANARQPVCFRLRDADHVALVALAKRAGVGHSTLCRRIVEHYIREHAPKRGGRK
jgi:hypothetical protein